MAPLGSSSPTPSVIAEWIEVSLLLEALNSTWSKSVIRQNLQEANDAGDARQYSLDYDRTITSENSVAVTLSDEDAEGISPSEQLADDAIAELQNFAEIVGDNYPFEVTERSVKLRGTPDDWPIYRFLLALSARYRLHLPMPAQEPARLFERVSAAAWGKTLGGNAEHFGWPRTSGPVGQRSFQKAAPTLIHDMGERLTRQASDIPRRHKDFGCDVAAWVDLRNDRRRGKRILLAQCAIGADWDKKTVNVEAWRSFVTFAVTPSRGASFPFVPAVLLDRGSYEGMDFEYESLGANVGYWLDRLRIAAVLDPTGSDLPCIVLQQVKEWTRRAVASLTGEVSTVDSDNDFDDLDAAP